MKKAISPTPSSGSDTIGNSGSADSEGSGSADSEGSSSADSEGFRPAVTWTLTSVEPPGAAART